MTAQRGKDMLLKIGDGGAPEAFTSVGGLRARTLSLNAAAVDVTHAESGGWRELLGEAGVRQASVAGAGVFLADEAAALVRSVFFSGAVRTFRIVIPGFGQITGPFLIGNLDYAGASEGEVDFSIALESAGPLSFEALP
ncbi:MAG: phage major tail protein, TP901-1 family [Parvularculaceae bacterium]|jgi:TP901-1 family phage major tail protein|nr:phage major tail protein, TP901-1 family [Parvularculaceae bacterium]